MGSCISVYAVRCEAGQWIKLSCKLPLLSSFPLLEYTARIPHHQKPLY